MAASAIEIAISQVQAALLGATAAANRVVRGRVDALDRAELPAINIRRARTEHSDHGQSARGFVDRVTVEIELDMEVRGDDWETQADALHVEADAALFANATLASSVRGLRCTSTDASAEGGDEIAGRITARYQFQLLVRRGAMANQA